MLPISFLDFCAGLWIVIFWLKVFPVLFCDLWSLSVAVSFSPDCPLELFQAFCVFPTVPFRVPTVTVDVFLFDLLDCFTDFDFACFSFEIVCLAGSFVLLTSACFQIKVWIYFI